MEAIKLDFIGIGAGKAGTTWLASNLARHPNIFIPNIKELNYFCSKHFWPELSSNRDKGLTWLNEQFIGRSLNQKYGEFSPSYLVDMDSPRIIKEHNPDIKLLINFRNPVDALYSAFFERGKYYKVEDTFEDFLKSKPEYIQKYFLHTHTSRFLPYFNRDQFHFIVYDDIVSEPGKVFSNALEFLNVYPMEDIEFVRERVHTRKEVRNSFVRDTIGKSRELLNANRYTRTLKNILSAIGVEDLANKASNFNIKPGSYVDMKKETRAFLIVQFEQEVKQLSELIGRDLSNWLDSAK